MCLTHENGKDDAEMEQLYLMPGEERYTKFRDENGVPKIRYTYCSLHGKLFNCVCRSTDEAQRLCEDWLVTQVRILGDFRLSGLLLFLCVFFFCEEQFNIFLCLYQLLHFFSCLAIVRVGCFLLGQKIGILCIQCFDLRQLF